MSPLRPALFAVALLSARVVMAGEVMAPEYSARRLGGTEIVSLASLRGRVVLLNTWATWCLPCRQEMPAFEALYRDPRNEGLQVVGVNIDEGQADEQVARYVEAKGISFPIWRDPENRFARRFRALGVPETLLLSREGIVVRHWQGAIDPQAPENLAAIRAAIGTPSSMPRPEVSGGGMAPEAQPSAQRGRRLAEQRGCLTCHATDGTRREGPSLKGGKEVVLADGRTLLRDREYLTRAIVEPDADVVFGYAKGVMAGAMPGGKLTEPEVESLVLYILSVSGLPPN